MCYFWWGRKGNFNLIILGSERVENRSEGYGRAGKTRKSCCCKRSQTPAGHQIFLSLDVPIPFSLLPASVRVCHPGLFSFLCLLLCVSWGVHKSLRLELDRVGQIPWATGKNRQTRGMIWQWRTGGQWRWDELDLIDWGSEVLYPRIGALQPRFHSYLLDKSPESTASQTNKIVRRSGDRQKDRQTGTHTVSGGQAGRQTDRQTDRQIDRQTGSQAGRQTNRPTEYKVERPRV